LKKIEEKKSPGPPVAAVVTKARRPGLMEAAIIVGKTFFRKT